MDNIQIATYSYATHGGSQGAMDAITDGAAIIARHQTNELVGLIPGQFQLKYYEEGCILSCMAHVQGGRSTDHIEGHIFLPVKLNISGESVAQITCTLTDYLSDTSKTELKDELKKLAQKQNTYWEKAPEVHTSDPQGREGYVIMSSDQDWSDMLDSSRLFHPSYFRYSKIILSKEPTMGEKVIQNQKYWINISSLDEKWLEFMRTPNGTLAGWENDDIKVTWSRSGYFDIIKTTKLGNEESVVAALKFEENEEEKSIELRPEAFAVKAQYDLESRITVNGKALPATFSKKELKQAEIVVKYEGDRVKRYNSSDISGATPKKPVLLEVPVNPPSEKRPEPPGPPPPSPLKQCQTWLIIAAVAGLLIGITFGEIDNRKLIGKVFPKFASVTEQIGDSTIKEDTDSENNEVGAEENQDKQNSEKENFDKLMAYFDTDTLKQSDFDACGYKDYWDVLNLRDYEKIREWDTIIRAIDANVADKYKKLMEAVSNRNNPKPRKYKDSEPYQFTVTQLINSISGKSENSSKKPQKEKEIDVNNEEGGEG